MSKVLNPFKKRIKVVGLTNFDKHYISYDVKDVVKKIGDDDSDFIITKKIIVKKDNIYELINSQASEVGVYNILKRATLVGDDSILNEFKAPTGEIITDVSTLPTDFASLFTQGNNLLSLFNSLPADLVNGRTFAQFCETFTQAEYDAFVAKHTKKEKEEVNNG